MQNTSCSLTNASLVNQITAQSSPLAASDRNDLYNLTTNTTYPALTIFGDSDVALIAFKAIGSDYELILPLVGRIFDNGSYSVPVACVFPISGQYDVLVRMSFYVMIISSLIFYKSHWLSKVLLGTAMAYSAVAAIHVLILISNYDFVHSDMQPWYNSESSKGYGDFDIMGCFPVLAAAAIMVTPVLSWSTTIRTDRARPVVILWAILIFIALIPAWQFSSPHGDLEMSFYPNEASSFALCPRSAGETHPMCNESLLYLDYSTYSTCGCIDFCATFSPPAPLRRGANMVSWISREISDKNIYESKYFPGLTQFNRWILVPIYFQGIWALFWSSFTNEEVRSIIFRSLNSTPRDWVVLLLEGKRRDRWLEKLGLGSPVSSLSKQRKGWLQRTRREIARLCAASSFLIAVTFAMLCPAVFVTSAVANEIWVGEFPVSEHSDSIGAWGVWAQSGLLIITAMIIQYDLKWQYFLETFITSLWRWLAYDADDDLRYAQNDRTDQLEKYNQDQHPGIGSYIWHIPRLLYCHMKAEYGFFKTWWNHPEERSLIQRHEVLEQKNIRIKELLGSCEACLYFQQERFKALEHLGESFGQRLLRKLLERNGSSQSDNPRGYISSSSSLSNVPLISLSSPYFSQINQSDHGY